jgi:hypothetical protein
MQLGDDNTLYISDDDDNLRLLKLILLKMYLLRFMPTLMYREKNRIH